VSESLPITDLMLAAAAGGACGAVLRWVIAMVVAARTSWPTWTGTLIANLLACFGVGLLLSLADPLDRTLLIAGFFGALSTFSTFVFELTVLLLQRRRLELLLAAVLTVVLGPLLYWAGGWCESLLHAWSQS